MLVTRRRHDGKLGTVTYLFRKSQARCQTWNRRGALASVGIDLRSEEGGGCPSDSLVELTLEGFSWEANLLGEQAPPPAPMRIRRGICIARRLSGPGGAPLLYDM
jgi:hypothetical protein